MTTVLDELIDWALFEELKDERPCYDCSAKAVWMERIKCHQQPYPKCDVHKKMREDRMRRVEWVAILNWDCSECGASGRLVPGSRVWELVSWEPL